MTVYKFQMTLEQAELMLDALEFFKGRLDFADSRCDNVAHRTAAKYTKRRIDELANMLSDTTGLSRT